METKGNIERDRILQNDLEKIVNSNTPIIELNNKTVLVTGATGLIGSQIVKALAYYNKLRNTNIKIVGLARSEKRVKEAFEEILDNGNIKIVYGDITKPIHLTESIDYIIHCASITSSEDFINYPVETIQTTFVGTKNMLDLAKEKKVKSFVYLSSLEVYGVTDPNLDAITENDYGYIDITHPRSSYSESKRMAENLCSSYAYEYNVPTKIARLTQTFGPGVKYTDNRVFAQFARSVIEKKDIVLHTMGDTVRSYCYLRDAITAILFILIKGEKGQPYNVANMETNTSIREMAEMITKEFPEAGISVVYKIHDDTTKFGYNPTVKIRLDTSKLQNLGWNPEIGLLEMYQRMIMSMTYLKNNVNY